MAKFAVLIFAIGALASAHGAKIVQKEGRPCEISFERNYECSGPASVGLRVRPSTVRACQCIDMGWMRCEQTNRACIPSSVMQAMNAAKQPEPVQEVAAAEPNQGKGNLESNAVAIPASEEPAREEPAEVVALVLEVVAAPEPAKETSAPTELEPAKEVSAPAAEPEQEVAPAEPQAPAAVSEPAKESPVNPEPAPQLVVPEPEPAKEVAAPEPAKETAEPEPTKKAAEPEPAKEVAESEPVQEQNAPAEPPAAAAPAEAQPEPPKEFAQNAPVLETMEVEIIPKTVEDSSIPIYHISPIVNAGDIEKQRLAIELAGENYIYFAGYNDEERIR